MLATVHFVARFTASFERFVLVRRFELLGIMTSVTKLRSLGFEKVLGGTAMGIMTVSAFPRAGRFVDKCCGQLERIRGMTRDTKFCAGIFKS